MFLLQIYWSENGELCCISTEESFFILKFSQEAVDQAKDNKESVTEDGIEEAFDVRNFVYLDKGHFPLLLKAFSENIYPDSKIMEHFTYRKMENFRIVQFSRNFAVGRDPGKLKSAKYIPSLSKVKVKIHKRTKIRFCSSHFLYTKQTKTQV